MNLGKQPKIYKTKPQFCPFALKLLFVIVAKKLNDRNRESRAFKGVK